jgi:hypothetical protein
MTAEPEPSPALHSLRTRISCASRLKRGALRSIRGTRPTLLSYQYQRIDGAAVLLTAMWIARQSLYNAFQDKRALYLETLERYQRTTTAGHLQRLNGAASPIAGVEALLLGLISNNDDIRALGCMGVGAVCEFGSTDPDIAALRAKVSPALRRAPA